MLKILPLTPGLFCLKKTGLPILNKINSTTTIYIGQRINNSTRDNKKSKNLFIIE